MSMLIRDEPSSPWLRTRGERSRKGGAADRRREVLDFTTQGDDQTSEPLVELPLAGPALLDEPVFNKGSAFPDEERSEFGLHGLLPPHVGSMEEQLQRRYDEFQECRTPLDAHIYLRSLQDRNETLFYRLMSDHVTEMMPLIYTPTVGEACQRFHRIYRKPRGLFLAYELRDRLDALLDSRRFRDIDVIVMTDGERILGLGDLGVGGMGIPVGKLALYTLCGGIHPARTLPLVLDVGTDNPAALADPLYLGARHPRVRGQEYDDFIEQVVLAIERAMPGVLLQWEDFAQSNARRLLDRYRDRLRTFNDDIQGTAAVALAAVLAAARATGAKLSEQHIVILGGGSAGTGIADALAAAMTAEGLAAPEARERISLVGRHGLIHAGTPELKQSQRPYAQTTEQVTEWARDGDLSLKAVVEHVRPDVLIGTTGEPGMFTEEVIRTMARHVARPAIFPLSNPTSRSEANPADVLAWTDGRALVAAGSPFPPVALNGNRYPIAQCNNVYIFPGLGQGVIASGARRVSDGMFLAAARALTEHQPVGGSPTPLLPPLEEITAVSRRVALAVALQAQAEGLAASCPSDEMKARIAARWWSPQYPRLRRRR